jgi:hypothetical protein
VNLRGLNFGVSALDRSNEHAYNYVAILLLLKRAAKAPRLDVQRRQRSDFVGATWGPLRLASALTKSKICRRVPLCSGVAEVGCECGRAKAKMKVSNLLDVNFS